MRAFLIALFSAIFVVMIGVTLWAASHSSLFDPAVRAAYNAQPWAIATLFDACCGFITFFVWVAFRERGLGVKILWLVLILLLGNIAMSFYVLLQLFHLKPDEPFLSLFAPRTA
ncbi:MAG TPA: DUF1475 family protein [Candidatus Acidoferrales bacterium]|nr:DUF1475 family protein [Candidatus Acidoferrales bacterium]